MDCGCNCREQLTNGGPTAVAVAFQDRAVEAVCPATNPACLWHNLQFILVVGNDFSKLVLDIVGIDWLATNACKRFGCLLKLALLDEVAGRFGEDG